MFNIFLLIIIIVILFNFISIENFDVFHEKSDNYNLKNRTDFYKKLRNTIGCNRIL